MMVQCEVCKVIVRIPPYRAKTFRTCSHYCFAILKSGGLGPQCRICRQCGKVELVRPSRASRPYCSMACRGEALRKADEDKKPRDPEARRVNRRRSKVKRTLRRKGFEGDVGDLTTEQWKVILRAFGGRCAYCGEVVTNMTMDHIIPAAKGGRHVASNVVPACMPCNQKKHALPVEPTFLPTDWPDIERILSR